MSAIMTWTDNMKYFQEQSGGRDENQEKELYVPRLGIFGMDGSRWACEGIPIEHTQIESIKRIFDNPESGYRKVLGLCS